MTIITKRSLIALLLSLTLIFTLFTVCVSADNSSNTGTTEVVTTEKEETTTAGKGEQTTEKDGQTTEAESKTEAETEDKEAKETSQALIINGAIIGAIIIAIVVLAIKFRVKLGEFFRSVKSELKKIVWASKENTLTSFLVVAVVAFIFAVVFWLVDLAFSTGIMNMLPELVKYLKGLGA